jgi:hypothetical protein
MFRPFVLSLFSLGLSACANTSPPVCERASCSDGGEQEQGDAATKFDGGETPDSGLDAGLDANDAGVDAGPDEVEAPLPGRDPSRVLILYNAGYVEDGDGDGAQDSLQVAHYYAAKRAVPAGNILGLYPTVTENYAQAEYALFQSEIVAPVKAKLAQLGATTIDVLLLCYGLPGGIRDGKASLDNALMGLNAWNATVDNVSWSVNPYLELNPTFGSDRAHFDHALHKFGGTQMYLVTRLDAALGVGRVLDLIDQALYADRFASLDTSLYGGIAYVD